MLEPNELTSGCMIALFIETPPTSVTDMESSFDNTWTRDVPKDFVKSLVSNLIIDLAIVLGTDKLKYMTEQR